MDEKIRKVFEETYAALEREGAFEDEEDMVNHPSHYQGRDGLEAIDVLESFLEPYQLEGFYKGNAIKYILRAGRKDPSKASEDLYKAIWNLDRLAWMWAQGE